MNKEYHYLLMSQEDLLQNEVIEEILRERTNSYIVQNKKNDFWILISPNFVKNPDIYLKIKETNFYKQKKISLIDSNQKNEFYASIISSNKEFIIWLNLRLGYFEDLQTFSDKKQLNPNYTSNGIYGKLDISKDSSFKKDLFKFNLKYIYPNILISKYRKFLDLFYSSIN
jgi:hypothetical protein